MAHKHIGTTTSQAPETFLADHTANAKAIAKINQEESIFIDAPLKTNNPDKIKRVVGIKVRPRESPSQGAGSAQNRGESIVCENLDNSGCMRPQFCCFHQA